MTVVPASGKIFPLAPYRSRQLFRSTTRCCALNARCLAVGSQKKRCNQRGRSLPWNHS